MLLSPNSRLGTYEILGPLGAGGMGEVYRARDTRLSREVAIKVLPADVASTPDRLERFEREARAVARLNHPNIVTLFTVEDADGIRFLTMELVEGQTLATLVSPGGVSLARILELAIPLTDALVAAHEKGVIHRDLKPANIMVTREARLKVLDFGLAKLTRADAPVAEGAHSTATDASTVTVEGSVAGTVPYMAPEQLRNDPMDARSDLFSLGVILYELATGERPFTGSSAAEITSSILRDEPEPLCRARADLPPDLERIVSQCLAKDLEQRAQSALVVNNELRRLRRDLERGEPEKPASDKVASIAVLPFVNRSHDEDDEYFSDGLADELLTVLSKIKGLRVTARSSAFTFKGKQATAAEIGRALKVATLLEGSVRKVGTRIRVSVQLVNVADSSHLWSEKYDRMLEDIFAVQDDIAQSVVKELRTTLLGEEPDSNASGAAKADVAQAAKGRGSDPEAHRLYLLARHLLDRGTREETAKAIEYLKAALTRHPEYALAWAELARAYGDEADRGWVPVTEGYGRARESVERALSLDPNLPEAHWRLGWIRMINHWDFRGAEASLSRALELAPGNAGALNLAGALAQNLGRLEEAIGLFHRRLERDPLAPASYLNLGLALEAMDRFAEAEAAYRKALEIAPHMAGTRAHLSLTLLALGRGEEALAEATREPDEAFRLWAQATVHHRLGHPAESDAVLDALIEKYSEDSAYQLAALCAVRGEVNRALEWLERAYVQRDGGLTAMKTDPRLRSLHGDPRWNAFLEKMGLEY